MECPSLRRHQRGAETATGVSYDSGEKTEKRTHLNGTRRNTAMSRKTQGKLRGLKICEGPQNPISQRTELSVYVYIYERSERACVAGGEGMRRSEEAKVSEEAVRRKGGGGGPRKLGMS